MKHTLVVVVVVVILLLGISKNSGASALGLADGTYNIEIDFSAVFSDLNGTITIGPAPSFVTSFDVGDLECTNCTVGSSGPDLVEVNDGSTFKIIDSNTAFLVILSSGGSAFGTFNCPPDISCNFSAGVWTAQSVPEPLSATLLLLGIGALGLWRRSQAKQD
jgi:hypothetical protein